MSIISRRWKGGASLERRKICIGHKCFHQHAEASSARCFGSLWSKLGDVIDSGIAISCEEVLDELTIGNDFLVQWAKERNGTFLCSSKDIQLVVREILQQYPLLVTGTRKANSADPFVIALARKKECTLVSDETKAGNGQPEKIPNVCEAYGVKTIKFVDFLCEMKISV